MRRRRQHDSRATPGALEHLLIGAPLHTGDKDPDPSMVCTVH